MEFSVAGRRRRLGVLLGTGLGSLVLMSSPVVADDDEDAGSVEITFIHTGDFHGDYHPHTNGRGDAAGMLEGGIARAVTVINDIRDDEPNVIHVHTGDTIHGSGEASITKGMALVRLVDQLGIDVAAPGNWEFAYTPYRYMQFFGVHDAQNNNLDIQPFSESAKKAVKYTAAEQGDVPPQGPNGTPFREVEYITGYNHDGTPRMAVGYTRWGMVASNVYQNGSWPLDAGVVPRGKGGNDKGTGWNLTPPYRIIERDGVKIGFIGCTTNRGPQVVSSTITTGVTFSNCKGGIKFPQNRPIDWDDQAISHTPWIVTDPATGAGYWQPGNKVTDNEATDAVQAANRDAAAETTGWNVRPHNGGDAGYKVKNEIVRWTRYLRDVKGVDLVAVMSEAGIAENIYAAENLGKNDPTWDGPDIYFSSDMHEESNYPVVVTDPSGKKVIVVENPEDIAQISELEIKVRDGRIVAWEFTGHDVDERVAEDIAMADMVDQIDLEIAARISSGNAYNPYNNHNITHQLTDVVGSTDGMILERNRFTNEYNPAKMKMPAVVEGTGHDLVTDMFRKLTGSDVGGIRGFRYTNSVLDGDDISYKALYHFYPIGPQVARGSIPTTTTSEAFFAADPKHNGKNKRHFVAFPRSLQQEMELAGNSTMNPIVPNWGGGWFWNYSGIKFDLQPSGPNFNKYGTMESARIGNMRLYDNANPNRNGPVDDSPGAKLSYASYYYHEDYNRINRNQLVPGGGCPNKKLTKDCVMAKTDIRIMMKEAASGDYVLVDTLEYDAGLSSGELQVLDTVEALGRYISDATIRVYDWNGGAKTEAAHSPVAGLGGTVAGNRFEFPRIRLIKANGAPGNDLTDCSVEFGFPCIEPFRGSEAALAAGTVSLPPGYIKGNADTPADEGNF